MNWCRMNRPELWSASPQKASLRRRFSWLLSRLLLFEVLGTSDVVVQDDRKPRPVGRTEKISLSHSRNAAALWLSASRQGGIDIQATDQRLLRAGPYFLSPEQNRFVQKHTSDSRRLFLLLKSWTLKEAVLKASSNAALDYIHGILVGADDWARASDFPVLEVDPSGLSCRQVVHFCNENYHLSFTL